MSWKVLFINPLKDYIEGLKSSTPDGYELVVLPAGTGVDEQIAQAADADFIVSGIEIPEAVFRAATRAKFIQYMSSGYGQLSLEVLNDLGIPVAQMKTHSISVAEHAVTLILSLLRRIPAATVQLREGKWRQDLDEGSYAELYGKTVGIVGLGNIGRWVGKIVHHGFGANVIYYDHNQIPLTISELISAREVSLEDLMRESDVVCVNMPLNQGTNRLIGTEELAMMKDSAVLVNVGRGEVIDETALIQALQRGQIAGAGLDVFANEPLDLNSELLTMDSVICTPHMAGVGWENVQRRIATVWSNIDAVVRGEVPVGVVTEVKRPPVIQAVN
ncbi:NAD(P)-dependent oxidoreductase [Glutamicibacter sp. NPDC087344]|uniref:NAD(P)-dependent oxidoreductase n=1 Tax=Glutamicibacter sp. NPDC087344 TaxID=3363994 RepID=UPI0037F4967B